MPMYEGNVEEGTHKATELGYPTINISLTDPDVSGSYAARVTVTDKTYEAVAYADQERGILEAHIMDFTDRVYDSSVSIELLEKIREAETITDEELMRETIRGDITKAKAYFAKLPAAPVA